MSSTWEGTEAPNTWCNKRLGLMPPIICRCTQSLDPINLSTILQLELQTISNSNLSLPGAPLSDWALESELDVEDESSSSGSSLVSELSSNKLEKHMLINIILT